MWVSARALAALQGNYVKDLSLLGRPIESVIIVDNAPVSYMFHPENSMASESFIEDPNDRELLEMIPFLESIADVPVRNRAAVPCLPGVCFRACALLAGTRAHAAAVCV